MKENKIIKKLKMLKAVKPSERALESIKRDVFYRIQTDKRQSSFFNILQLRPVLLYGTLALAVFLLVLTASITPFSTVGEKLYMTAQIEIAQNKYQKANIAFAYAKKKLTMLKKSNDQLNASQIENVSYAVNLANAQLAGLNLMGEEGKYTAASCQQLYKKYYTYLEEVKNTIASRTVNVRDDVSKRSIELFSTQLEEYIQQAKGKLNSY